MIFFKAMKYDVVRSILSRCEVLCEDVMDSQEEKTSTGTFILHVILIYPWTLYC